jgi:PAS domain S-box-containing protein
MKKNKQNNKANSLLNEIFNTAADGMCLIDKEFNIFAINTTLTMMLGLEKDEIIGKKCHEVLVGSACQTECCCLIKILSGEEQIEFETEKLRSD